MIDCRYIEEKLVEILERSLDSDKQVEIDRHIADCRHCRELVESYQPLFDQLNKKEKSDPPEELWRDLQAQINSHEELKKTGFYLFPDLRKALAVSAKSFALVAALVVGVYLGGGIVTNGESELIAEQYSALFSESSQGSLLESYFDIDLNNGGTGQ